MSSSSRLPGLQKLSSEAEIEWVWWRLASSFFAFPERRVNYAGLAETRREWGLPKTRRPTLRTSLRKVWSRASMARRRRSMSSSYKFAP